MDDLLKILAAMSGGYVVSLKGGAYKTASPEEPRGVPLKIVAYGRHGGFVVQLDNGEAAYYHPTPAATNDYISDAAAGRAALLAKKAGSPAYEM